MQCLGFNSLASFVNVFSELKKKKFSKNKVCFKARHVCSLEPVLQPGLLFSNIVHMPLNLARLSSFSSRQRGVYKDAAGGCEQKRTWRQRWVLDIMASTLVILLQLLLVSLVSASHNYGGSVTHSYKGRTPDGSFRVRDMMMIIRNIIDNVWMCFPWWQKCVVFSSCPVLSLHYYYYYCCCFSLVWALLFWYSEFYVISVSVSTLFSLF